MKLVVSLELKTLLGKNVKYYRFKAGLTQEQLAERINASTNYVGRLERGQHNPSLAKIELIAHSLNIESYELLMKHTGIDRIPNCLKVTTKNN